MSPFLRRSFGRPMSRGFGHRRQRLQWFAAATAGGLNPGQEFSVIMVPDSFLETMTRPTLIRIHGEITVFLSSAAPGAAGDAMSLWFGHCFQNTNVTDEAQVPKPFNNGISGLFVQHCTTTLVQTILPAGNTTDVYNNLASTVTAARIVVDNRSKRISDTQNNLWFGASNIAISAPGGGSQAGYSAVFRYLFRETRG